LLASNKETLKLAILSPSFGDGGAERMLVNLSCEFVLRGFKVDFLISRADGPYLSSLSPSVKFVELGSSKTTRALKPLVRYLGEEQPPVLLAAKDRGNEMALLVKRFPDISTRVAVRLGTTVSRMVKSRNPIKSWIKQRTLRKLYPRADIIIAVSRGVASDMARTARIPPERIHVLPNPVLTPQMSKLAQMPVNHPWFVPGAPPVILGVGRLGRAKDFPTLLRAFARVQKERPARLVILGKGGQKSRLQTLASKLGIAENFSLLGFASNPYAYMARSALFVLSSKWEGSPNALTEAMALGTPVVSTDCESGPREILGDGRYGPLVPVEDPNALALAMLETMEHPPDPDILRSAVKAYTVEASANHYLAAMGLPLAAVE